MRKETITYTDYNGEERTEDFYFNLTMAEITEIQLGIDGGLSEKLKKVHATKNVPEAIKFFKDLILRSYGEKSDDGKYFNKSPELSERFSHTEAYSVLFMKFATNPEIASNFVNSIVPADLAKKAAELEAANS